MGNKHTQMPHELGMNKGILLKPVDKLVYVYLRSYADKNLQTFVSMDTLAERCELSWKTVSDSIVRLLEAQELFLVSEDSGRRCRTYKIAKDERHFEMFSQDFLDHLKEQDFTISEKCVLICLHEHSYKTQNYGELKGTLTQMANSINMPEKSFKRAMLSLKKKGVIKDEYNQENQLVRRVEWKKIMMDMLYQVKQNTEDIVTIKQELSNTKTELDEVRKELKDAKDVIKQFVHRNSSSTTFVM